MESLSRHFYNLIIIILDQIVAWGLGGFSICFCFQEHCLYVNNTFCRNCHDVLIFVSQLLFHNTPYMLIIMHYVMKNAYIFSKTKHKQFAVIKV